jgi:hypothetical protein
MTKCTNCDEGAVATHTVITLKGLLDLCDKCCEE